MCLCLESQFDSSILDRVLIIIRIQQLTSILPDEEILTCDFFIQRFEKLAVEGQLLVKDGESNFIQGSFLVFLILLYKSFLKMCLFRLSLLLIAT